MVGLLALKYTEAALEGPAVALDAEAQDARLAVLTDVVPVSDGYIPFRDNVDHAARALTPISHQAACRVTECHFVSIRYVHFLDGLPDTFWMSCSIQAALAAPSLRMHDKGASFVKTNNSQYDI